MKALYSLVGMKHLGAQSLVASMINGEPLIVKREPDNAVDSRACQVWARDQHVGYIKASENADLADYMDVKKLASLPAKLVAGNWPHVEVET